MPTSHKSIHPQNRNKEMKKLLALSYSLFLVALSVAMSSPLPLFLQAPGNYVVLGVSTDVSGITAYADEHKRDLISTLVNGLDIANDITVIPNVKNKIQLSKVAVGNGFRPYSATHEPKTGHIVFSDRQLEVLVGKVDLLIDSKAFQAKHLAWRTSPGNRASKTFNDMDFAPYVWDQVIKGLQREINDETAYYGFDSSATPTFSEGSTYAANLYVKYTVNGVVEYFQNISGGTTTAGEDPLDTPAKWRNVTARAVVPGIKSHIDAAIAATTLSQTSTGAITTGATARAAFKELFRDMPAPYKNNGVIIHASHTDCEWLLDGQEDITKYTTPEMVHLGLIPIIGTNGKGYAKPATWLGTSRRLIAEPMIPGTGMGMNLVMGTDLLSDANDINTVPDVHTIKTGITVSLGFQIQDLSALRVGDQA